MKRSLAIALAIALSTTLSPPVSATVSPSARDSRLAQTCGDLCVQGQYPGSYGAWFIDGTDTAVMVGDNSFRVISTATQKTVKTVSAPRRKSLDAFALSSDKSHAVAAFTSGHIYVYDTATWTATRANVTDPRPGLDAKRVDVRAVAVSNDGDDVYLGRWMYQDGSDPVHVEGWTDGTYQDGYSRPNSQGVKVLKLSNDQTDLYVGYAGTIPTLQSFDTSDIAAGPSASDNSTMVYSVDNIEITSDGRLFASNTADVASPSVAPRVVEYNPSTLAELDSYDIGSEWQRWAIGLSPDETSLYAVGEFVPQGSPDEPNRFIQLDIDTLAPLVGSLSLPGARSSYPYSVDVDPSGKYLLVARYNGTAIVSLDAGYPEPEVDLALDTNVVSWDYMYLNPKAKFKWFEVKYRKAGSSKWTVKRVKRGTSMTIPVEVAPGSDVIQVRAIYKKKSFNSGRGTFSIPL